MVAKVNKLVGGVVARLQIQLAEVASVISSQSFSIITFHHHYPLHKILSLYHCCLYSAAVFLIVIIMRQTILGATPAH